MSYRSRDERLEHSSAERHLGVLDDAKLSVSQQHLLAGKKVNHILAACINSRGVIVSLYSVSLRPLCAVLG